MPSKITSKQTSKYAVFGNPIAQSKSPGIHHHFAEQFDLDFVYSAVLVPVDDFESQVQQFFKSGGCGLNVTVPFKEQAFQLVDVMSDYARLAGAINTVHYREQEGQQQLVGNNTDGIGLIKDLTENLNWNLANARILILGAGGAVRGIIAPLLQQRPENIVIANRTVAKAQQIVTEFTSEFADAPVSACGYEELTEPFDVIINGTSASLEGQKMPVADIIFRDSSCYDMVYGKEPTIFMDQALAAGAKQVADGWGMLVEQAAAAFEIWTGKQPDTKALLGMNRAPA